MKNYVFKSFITTCVAGMAMLLTPKTSVAQVDMSLLTEVVSSCQQDVFSSEYYWQLGHQEMIAPNRYSIDDYFNKCIESRYFHSLVLSKLPWLASTGEMLPGYSGAVAVSSIARAIEPSRNIYYIYYSDFIDCLASQDSESKVCQSRHSFIFLYGPGNSNSSDKFDVTADDYDSLVQAAWYAYLCPSCYVAYNNYPSRKKIIDAFREWFMTLEPSRRKQLMSILGDKQTPKNNRDNIREEAWQAVDEYRVIRQRVAEEEKERRRRELFE